MDSSKKFHENSDIRDFQFMNNVNILNNEDYGILNLQLERVKTKISRNSKLIANLFHLNVPNHTGYVDLRDIKSGFELRGYYQSLRYYDHIIQDGESINWMLNFESDLFKNLKNKLTQNDFIAVHIRGGDYLKDPQIYQRLDTSYFSKSLYYLALKLGNLPIVVFTDDSDYAHVVLRDFNKMEIIEQENLRASEAMILISLARGVVISNSSFSYWAAMINQHQDIVAPEKWYMNKKYDLNLYPKKWTVIN